MVQRGLEKLQVWQEAMRFVEWVYREVIPHLPQQERFALQTQLQRAVQSIPANIAEGYGRYHYGDQIRFCYIARGSAEETFTFLTLAHRLGYLPETPYQQSVQAVERLKQMLNGYIRYLRQQQEHTK